MQLGLQLEAWDLQYNCQTLILRAHCPPSAGVPEHSSFSAVKFRSTPKGRLTRNSLQLSVTY